jgi:hypothetical protein
MQICYADNAVFNDEVFVNLSADEVRAMWEMFCIKGKDLQLSFSNVQADTNFHPNASVERGSAEWIANYTFSRTNRRVVNRIKADFIFHNGKIVRHTDHFNFYNWASQALGTPGILLGWTPLLKNKVRKEAMKNLRDYMSQRIQEA